MQFLLKFLRSPMHSLRVPGLSASAAHRLLLVSSDIRLFNLGLRALRQWVPCKC
jgi:hypothetical protein